MKKRCFDRIIKEICNEENIELILFSHDWIYKLKKNNKIRFIVGYNFDINTSSVYQISNDKSATFQVLKDAKIPCVPHVLFMRPSYFSINENYSILESIMDTFTEYNCDVVIKKNEGGTGGHDVYRATNKNELDDIVLRLFSSNKSISISPFVNDAIEYRCIILNDTVKVIYKKNRQSVIGDGNKTLDELLLDKYNSLEIKEIISNLVTTNIKRLDTVIEKDEEIILNWKHNLGLGAMPELLKSSDKHEKLKQLTLDAAKELNVSFASIDIIEKNNELYILEVNSGIMMEKFILNVEKGYEMAKSLYKEAIESMFK